MARFDRHNPFFIVAFALLFLLCYLFREAGHHAIQGALSFLSDDALGGLNSFGVPGPQAGLGETLWKGLVALIAVVFLFIGIVIVWCVRLLWQLYVGQVLLAVGGARLLSPALETAYVTLFGRRAAATAEGVNRMSFDETEKDAPEPHTNGAHEIVRSAQHFTIPVTPAELQRAAETPWHARLMERRLKRYRALFSYVEGTMTSLAHSKRASVEGLQAEIDFRKLQEELLGLDAAFESERRKRELHRSVDEKELEIRVAEMDLRVAELRKKVSRLSDARANPTAPASPFEQRLRELDNEIVEEEKIYNLHVEADKITDPEKRERRHRLIDDLEADLKRERL